MLKFKPIYIIFSIIVNLLLVSCGSFFYSEPKTKVKYLTPKNIDATFEISGRFFVKNSNMEKYGNFIWNKNNIETIQFSTPIGQTIVKIVIESSIITLYKDNKKYIGNSVDDLMDEELGFTIPINYLHYWLQGATIPNIIVDQNLSNGFAQLGWNIEYLEYDKNNKPKIIQISNSEVVIKLFINW